MKFRVESAESDLVVEVEIELKGRPTADETVFIAEVATKAFKAAIGVALEAAAS